MERLSCSPWYMWFKKKAAPLACALMALAASGTVLWHVPPAAMLRDKSTADLLTLLLLFAVPLAIAGLAIAFVLFKANSFMDEVGLDGNTLVLRNGRKIERVPLTDVLGASVKLSIYDDLDRTVVLQLRNSQFGKTVMFSVPRQGYLPSDAAQELVRRITTSSSTTS